MEELGVYRGLKLYGDFERNRSRDGKTYWVAVDSTDNRTKRLFTEGVSISGTAIAIKFSNNNDKCHTYLKELALSRATARIDIGNFENDMEYILEITSYNIEKPHNEQDRESKEIEYFLLKALKRIREYNPIKYKSYSSDLDGIASILGIDKKRLLFEAMKLKEDGFIQDGNSADSSVARAGGYITNKGLSLFEKLKTYFTEDDLEGEEIIMGDKIFIIHGHDNEMKREVQLLLSRADLEDVVLHEQPDRGRTIINKLTEESTSAIYAIALLSPDDELADGNARARQNVILEIGYFLGKLGKERVRLLKKGSVQIPSDLQGILYDDYDDSGAWKSKLLKEIRAVGIDLNLEKAIDKS